MERENFVISGMGALSPIGNNVADYWENLVNGRSGIDHVTRFPVDGLPTKIAGEVKGFEPAEYLGEKLVGITTRHVQYGLAAAKEALGNAN